MRAGDRRLHQLFGAGQETQLIQSQRLLPLVQEAHNDFFALVDRNNRNAERKRLLLHLHLKASVLRHHVLVNFQLGQNFKTGRDARLDRFGQSHHLAQDAINPVADR